MCAHMCVGMVLVVRQYVHHIQYGDKHTSACEVLQISPRNLSEGGLSRSPMKPILTASCIESQTLPSTLLIF